VDQIAEIIGQAGESANLCGHMISIRHLFDGGIWPRDMALTLLAQCNIPRAGLAEEVVE
jgi:hypothetical protein